MTYERVPPPAPGSAQRGPMKVGVSTTPRGVTKFTISAALKEALRPTPGDKNAKSWGERTSKLSVYLLVDKTNRTFAIQRAHDEADESYRVGGMSNAAYFTGWGLGTKFEIPDGHYEVSADTDLDLFVAKLDDRVPIVPRPKKNTQNAAGPGLPEATGT